MRQTVPVDPQQMLTTVSAVVAVLASAFGIFVAIDQLTASARQRRVAEFLEVAAKAEREGSPQHKVLVSLRRDTVARLVGVSAVPAWTMVGDACTVFVVACTTYVVTPMIMKSPPADFGGWSTTIVVTLLVLVTGWMFLSSLFARIDERRRIADDYLAGRLPLEPKATFSGRLSGGGPGIVAFTATVGITVVSVGAGIIASGLADPWSGLSYSWTGFVICGIAARGLRAYLARRRGHVWRHPDVASKGK